jgi:hypothetical protein
MVKKDEMGGRALQMYWYKRNQQINNTGCILLIPSAWDQKCLSLDFLISNFGIFAYI